MKKIINGRVYNTDTAALIGTWNDSDGKEDVGSTHEYLSLYYKHNHEFFIHRQVVIQEDGKMLEHVFPVTYAEAESFAKTKLKPEEYLAVFEVPEKCNPNDTVTIKVTLTRTAMRLIDSEARRTNGTIGGVISRLAETLR